MLIVVEIIQFHVFLYFIAQTWGCMNYTIKDSASYVQNNMIFLFVFPAPSH